MYKRHFGGKVGQKKRLFYGGFPANNDQAPVHGRKPSQVAHANAKAFEMLTGQLKPFRSRTCCQDY